MRQFVVMPVEMKVLVNHIYEYKKGVCRMVFYTFNKRYEQYAFGKLRRQGISYIVQPVDDERLNLYFGKKECLDAIRRMVTRSLNQLTQRKTLCSELCSVTIFAHNVNAIVNGNVMGA